MVGPLLFGVLLALGVLLAFVATWRMLDARDPIEARLASFGIATGAAPAEAKGTRRRAWPLITRIVQGLGLGPGLAAALSQADLPLTVSEFVLIVLLAGFLGSVLGMLRGGALLGLGLGFMLAVIPIVYLRSRQAKRKRQFTEQIPDVLTMLVGSLRAGHGMSQALGVLVDQLPPPASVEFRRVTRAISLGVPTQRALNDMADRVGSDDLDLVVTAINVQFELGGNLTQTLETIAETVRDRIRMKRQIRVLTSQQRLTGYILALLPVGLAVVLNLLNPEFMRPLFERRFLWFPILGLLMVIAGFLVIRRIVDIEV